VSVIVRARAPLRVSFAGGGTDVSPYCDERGGAVLSATFNKYVHVALTPNTDGRMGLHSHDYQTSVHYDVADALPFDGRLDLIKACIRRLYPERQEGFDIRVHSDAPPGSGAGASSALVVAVLAALCEWLRLPLTEYELAELAFAVERCDLRIEGGRQDHYAAAFGGFNFMEFGSSGAVVNPLRIRTPVISELEERIVLAYAGGSRPSAGILTDQIRRYLEHDEDAVRAMDELKELASAAKRTLLSGDIERFGEIADRAWQCKKRMSDRISTPALDEIYRRAREAGAVGGKVTGAGGGGYMFFVTRHHERKSVVDALRAAECQVVDFSFEAAGVQTWRVSESGLVG
jgi:D-glycero-alpha-D-manno-heptose-7-phosphate kinase